jgi:putative ABC transport system substrate-binding protein
MWAAMYSLGRPGRTHSSRIRYGIDLLWCFHRCASFVDKILRGERAGDLPVEFPTKLLLVINGKIAKALGLAIPSTVLTRADQVIE